MLQATTRLTAPQPERKESANRSTRHVIGWWREPLNVLIIVPSSLEFSKSDRANPKPKVLRNPKIGLISPWEARHLGTRAKSDVAS